MLTCILIDDNESVLENFKIIFGEFLTGKVQIVGTATNANDGESLIKELLPDFVILDVHMPQRGGLSVINQLHRQHIYRGIEQVKIYLYTGKTELYEAITDLQLKYPVRIIDKNTYTIEDWDNLLTETENWITADRAVKTIRIMPNNVYVGDIQYFKSVAPNTQVETQTAKKTLMASYPLAHFKKMITDQPTAALPLPQHFFFATNDYIFNRLFIRQYQHEIITLQNNIEIPIARTQKAAFEAWWGG
jgi:CheY-like chemotaxis protein